MTTYEIIKMLCDEQGLAVTALEQKLGFSRGSIGKLKEGRAMNTERIKKVAEYFGVSVDYLMTGTTPDGYYINKETAEMAQKIFEDEGLRLLFDVAKDSTPEELSILHALAKKFSEVRTKNEE